MGHPDGDGVLVLRGQCLKKMPNIVGTEAPRREFEWLWHPIRRGTVWEPAKLVGRIGFGGKPLDPIANMVLEAIGQECGDEDLQVRTRAGAFSQGTGHCYVINEDDKRAAVEAGAHRV